MRESEGVYTFGSKKVTLRVDANKINVRVGGGYLNIDEFLDQYTAVELEKLEKNDPLKRFSQTISSPKASTSRNSTNHRRQQSEIIYNLDSLSTIQEKPQKRLFSPKNSSS